MLSSDMWGKDQPLTSGESVFLARMMGSYEIQVAWSPYNNDIQGAICETGRNKEWILYPQIMSIYFIVLRSTANDIANSFCNLL